MFNWIRKEIKAVKERDPAANNTLEIVLAYPGLHAIITHRIHHWLYQRGFRTLPRLMAHFVRWVTGIEIHPGAKIGESFFIDHGMGVVIGETAEIGDNVTLYQGVTLGGTGKEKGKRHPTIGNNVVIAADATVLGAIEVGDNARIGAGAVVIKPVPPDSTVVGVPGRVVVKDGQKVPAIDLHHERLPDPVTEMFLSIQRRLDELEHKLDVKKRNERLKKKTQD